ncbi:site-specific tyrosine recombinase/integron integrase [Hippea maritima]|uniref:Tyrosine recombinase xerC n=1 Tax=Hippea maritima (strain ATCC 700847 / DSM 10411 / MH2) TaxID=760142 RepID=F2LTQ5_HIPMA|nr:site-specific tyrosine recombinase/integron integrase [Hippea maritima]AEA34431.1 Tyrosine recombinase xerC [Hippea maritima DSM 10411]
MSTVINEFEEYLNSKYSSKNTIKAYLTDTQEFLKNTKGFDRDDVEVFLVKLFDRGLSSSTITRKLASLSIFFEFLKLKGKVRINPLRVIDKPKQKKMLPKFLEVDDVVALLEGIKDKRDRALFELIYSSSLRASEALGLDINDIDFENLRIRIRRKGGKVVYVPISQRAALFLKDYLKDRKEGPLFLNRYGKRLSDRYLRRLIKKYALSSIFKDVSPHTLRHSKATHLLNSGMDIRLLQRLLGHSSIKATQIYTHLNLKELAQTYDSTHPLAKDDG